MAAAALAQQFKDLEERHALLQSEHAALKETSQPRAAESAGERAASEAAVIGPARPSTPTGKLQSTHARVATAQHLRYILC